MQLDEGKDTIWKTLLSEAEKEKERKKYHLDSKLSWTDNCKA